MRYRLGLDLGATSLGWCVVELDAENNPFKLMRMGARIFRDGRKPKDQSSLAVDRRLARQMRRRRDRLLKRKARLMAAMIRLGFMPGEATERKALTILDPYVLRKKGLEQALTPHEFGRALFHLNQRRGFKSNRKVDKGADEESGKVKTAIGSVVQAMDESGAPTVGAWLALRHEKRLCVRARKRGAGTKWQYELYLSRDLIKQEFDALWEKQAELQPAVFTESARAELRDILLFQRPLKPVKVGRCTLESGEERAALALPSTQKFRILQELNNLRIIRDNFETEALTLEQRNRIADDLSKKQKTSFDGIRKTLKLKDVRFNLESEKRDHLKGNATSIALSKDDAMGKQWHQLSLEQQDEIVQKIIDTESETELVQWLQDCHQLPLENALAVANTRLPDGYGMLSLKALSRLLPCLEADVITYDKAVIKAGYQSHSDFSTGEWFKQLPYYGQVLERYVAFGSGEPKDSDEKRYGRIANPTVHIGLNQLRVVINALIKKYGHPEEIIIEVARELKQSLEKRKQIQTEQAARQNENDYFRQHLLGLGLPDNPENMHRLRLWHELNKEPQDRRCTYTGEQISPGMLFGPEVEIDHILPFSRTLDDSLANKTVVIRRANRDKGNQTPYEAFSHRPDYDWAGIQERAAKLPKNKQWRFAENAMQEYVKDSDFLARHLNDTAYLCRVSKEYLSGICFPNKISVTPGRLTSLLRGKWGLNKILSADSSKNRDDHRHHAIDAAVIAVSDRSILQKISRASARASERHLNKLVDEMPMPWPTYQQEIEQVKDRIVISHKPDHGFEGALHKETAYGFAGEDEDDSPLVVHRVPIGTLESDDKIGTVPDSVTGAGEYSSEGVRDLLLRKRLLQAVGEKNGAERKAALAQFEADTKIRRVRVVERLNVIPIKDRRTGEIYKGYMGGSNYGMEIYRDEKGRWQHLIVSTFEAHEIIGELGKQIGFERLRHPRLAQNNLPLVMRLCKDDLIAFEENGTVRRIFRVVKTGANGQTFLAEHQESNCDQRNRDKNSGFKYLSKTAGTLFSAKARRVFVDPLGFVRDPGFHP